MIFNTQKYPIDNSFCKYARYTTRTQSFYQYPNPIRPKVENTYPLGPGVKFFSSSNARKNSVSSKIPTLPIPAPDLSWVAYLGLCIFCILLCLKLYSRPQKYTYMYAIHIYDHGACIQFIIQRVLLQIKVALLCSCCCQSKLLLSTFLKPILILSLGDLFLYGTETMMYHLKRQGWRSGFGTARGVRR